MSEEDLPQNPRSNGVVNGQAVDINVLVVGESQQGKSTLIKQLNRYAKQPPLDIGIGHGNVACTKVIGQYKISTKLQRYVLVNSDDNPVGDLSYGNLCDLGKDDARAVPESSDTADTVVDFNFIDTPGLDDSSGDDVEIMAAIIGRLGELNHVNAVLYVRSIDKPFSKSFKQFFNYIQRSIPSLSAGLIIVHTCFNVEKVAQFLENSENLAKVRQDAFKAATNLELIHFFMDNEPSNYSPFAVLESYNACYRVLNHLSVQAPVTAGGLQLLKTKFMESHDIQVVTLLLEIQNALQNEWNSTNTRKSNRDQKRNLNRLEMARCKKKLAAYRDRLSAIDGAGDIVLGTRAVADEYSWIINLLIKQEVNLGARRVDFIAECPIGSVKKTTNGGSQWQDEILQGSTWSAVISSSALRDLGGTATFYAKSRDKHRAEVSELEDKITDQEDHLQHLELSLDGDTEDDARIEEITSNIGKVSDLIEKLKSEKVDIGMYQHLRRFYASQGKASKDEIREFVTFYDPEVATLVSKY